MKCFLHAASAIVLMTASIYAGAPVGICLHAYGPDAPSEKIDCFEFEKSEKTPSSDTRFFLPNGKTAVVTAYRNRGIVLYPTSQASSPEAIADTVKRFEAYCQQSPATRQYLNPWILKLRGNQAAAAKQGEENSKLPTITLSDGTVLKGCKAAKKDAKFVSIIHADGIKKVAIADLSESTKKALELDALPMTAAVTTEGKPSPAGPSTALQPQNMEGSGQNPPGDAPQQELVDRKESIAIKGLYLGMAGENARKVIVGLGEGSITTLPTNKTGRVGYTILYKHPRSSRAQPCGDIFTDPKDSTVTEYFLQGVLSNFLFNTNELTVKEFAQKFMDSYDIPEFNPDTYKGMQCWSGHPKKPWKAGGDEEEQYTIRIFTDKAMMIQKTPKTKFD